MQSSSKRLLVKEFNELALFTDWEETTPDVTLLKALKESSKEIEEIELALRKNNIHSASSCFCLNLAQKTGVDNNDDDQPSHHDDA